MLKKYALVALAAVVVLALLDVETGVQILDQLIQAVPDGWLREVTGL
ncbi:hypothetical protein [Halovenus salina]|uniref:Uncharacterized protein n=1 Tax=Halovenus salina TaxID=1510225 RepID=A0ABD5W201_9EURY|nr:hypothetical protein [Halovenus salina]